MEMTLLLRPDFKALGYPLPDRLRVSCGFPSHGALAAKRRVIGQCWAASASGDDTIEIFISPVIEDAVEVGATLVHELVHAAVGPLAGHGAAFKRLAVGLGLEGPMRATRAGPRLVERLNVLAQQLGPYPHASLNALHRAKQGTRLRKVECSVCGCPVRMTQRWITVGLPTCHCGGPMRVCPEKRKKGA